MVQLTTPTHTFHLPFGVEQIDKVRVIYRQEGNVLLKKNNADCVLSGTTVSVTLSQAETNGFDENKHIEVQLRILTTDGTALSSKIFLIDCVESLDDAVLT